MPVYNPISVWERFNIRTFEEHDIVTVKETILVKELFGSQIEIQYGWTGTVVADADTGTPLIEFTQYSKEPILASIPIKNLVENLHGLLQLTL